METFPATYDFSRVEPEVLALWEAAGVGAPRPRSGPAFVVMMPPPNVTGILHVGHALDLTVQDALVRYHRLRGQETLWLPGVDHAGIATQARVEEEIAREGLTRHDLGREAFVDRVWAFKAANGDRIVEQARRMGASADFSRLRFTMDPAFQRAVREVFVRLYEQGLLYRTRAMIAFCPRCRTALSDIEVDHREVQGTLTTIHYPGLDGAEGIDVATTRPETLLGDQAVAVHPEDPRHRRQVGRRVRLPLLGRILPVIADAAVERDFGTGAVKVTPAHDPQDFAIAGRHGLPLDPVIDEDGRITALGGPYAGLSREAARGRVLEDLAVAGHIVRSQPIVHAVGHCERCGTVVEPLVSLQWFVRMRPLAEPALQALGRGLRIVPERFAKVYADWLEGIRDWCVSRQIWWGHRIPAFTCPQGHLSVVREDPPACPVCGRPVTQDPDVLDTWFSSALWPFATLGWPEATADLARYYPTQVLVTGWEILFFWVARMVMQGIHFTGEIPFDTVYLHGIVRDAQGRKMSKSLGNGVDPLEVIERFGADALRLSLIVGTAPGADLRYREARVVEGRNLTNKLWNAARFAQRRLASPVTDPDPDAVEDRWIRSVLARTLHDYEAAMAACDLGEAARMAGDFFWDALCDWYIELTKTRSDAAAPRTLQEVLTAALLLLHPFVPFVTEGIWQRLGWGQGPLALAAWPASPPADEQAEGIVQTLIALVRTGRNLRAEVGIAPSTPVPLVLIPTPSVRTGALEPVWHHIARLVRSDDVHLVPQDEPKPRNALFGLAEGWEVYLPLEGLVDLERERKRLLERLAALRTECARLAERLGNPAFLKKAPADVVEKDRNRRTVAEDELRAAEARLARFT